MCAYIPALLGLSPTCPVIPHLGHHRAQAELAVFYSSDPLAASFIRSSVYLSTPISQFIPPPLSPVHYVPTTVLSVCISIPALQTDFISTIFLDPHACVNIQH